MTESLRDQKGPVHTRLSQAAAFEDLDDAIKQAKDMGRLLSQIAVETQFDDPAVSARAAIGAARAAVDVIGTMMTKEKLNELEAAVRHIKAERESNRGGFSALHGDLRDPVIGIDKNGVEVRRPRWGRNGIVDRSETDAEENKQTGIEGGDEQGGTDTGGDGTPNW